MINYLRVVLVFYLVACMLRNHRKHCNLHSNLGFRDLLHVIVRNFETSLAVLNNLNFEYQHFKGNWNKFNFFYSVHNHSALSKNILKSENENVILRYSLSLPKNANTPPPQNSSSWFDNFSQKKVTDTSFLSENMLFQLGILVYICRIFKLNVNDKRRQIWVVKTFIYRYWIFL